MESRVKADMSSSDRRYYFSVLFVFGTNILSLDILSLKGEHLNSMNFTVKVYPQTEKVCSAREGERKAQRVGGGQVQK